MDWQDNGAHGHRRRFARRPIHLPAVLRVGNDDVPAVTENISLGGAFLRVDELPATADQVVASIELPHGRSLRVRANIRWRRHEPPGVGIEFDSFLEQGLG